MMITALALLFSSSTAMAAAAADVAEPNPKEMKQSEIRAFNAKLAKDHPYYIRCVREPETGTLVARKMSCRTNGQWAVSAESGNREARDIMDEMRSKAASQSN
ncbi:hypothetical protein B0I00_2576 [Novosphingobium kunmingense]|uniref:Uncharacterized protein n=1 Tax=Novosphingobium kunmingense TaxID=1211806 RepID=A0A2N0H4T5_9SPHN|nr:hypothetical protein [Novosphingobium kunmingense]PKB13948.1 hypothetical protein B0I00_2576 [Novosphingobium kunmingense]